MSSPGDVTRRRRHALVRRSAPERALAWLFTGPLGHLYGVVADVAVMAVRHLASKAGR